MRRCDDRLIPPYRPRPVSAADLALMRRIDELHLEFPFAGSRLLRPRGKIGRLHVATLMKRIGRELLYRRPRTTKLGLGTDLSLYRQKNSSEAPRPFTFTPLRDDNSAR